MAQKISPKRTHVRERWENVNLCQTWFEKNTSFSKKNFTCKVKRKKILKKLPTKHQAQIVDKPIGPGKNFEKNFHMLTQRETHFLPLVTLHTTPYRTHARRTRTLINLCRTSLEKNTSFF